jgi:hypothetical protein
MKSTGLSVTGSYPTLMGYTDRIPQNWPAIDRRALMRDAHQIARNFRTKFASYREAMAYGLWAAWLSAKSRQAIQSLAIQAGPTRVPHTSAQIKASRRATRQCGSSLWAS